MLQKSHHVDISSQKAKALANKKLRFNEENIRDTLHPTHKDYGFMTFSEAKTPYPRHADPVVAEELRQRLQECLDRANRMMHNVHENDDDDDDEHSYNMEPITPMGSLESEDEERRHFEFIKKRKQFYKAEYIIAQQKSMSSEMPEPGPSIGNNWRILDNDASNATYNVPSNFTTFFDKAHPPPVQSNANSKILREIVRDTNCSELGSINLK